MFRFLLIFAVCLSFSRAIDWVKREIFLKSFLKIDFFVLLWWEYFLNLFLQDEPNELDAYVHSEDGFFSWTELEHYELEELDIYMLNMTSQQWMDGEN